MARYLNLVIAACLVAFAHSAAIDRTTDSYQNQPIEDYNIDENLIPNDEELGSIDGLLPPKPDATDFYKTAGRRESDYAIDDKNSTLVLKDASKNKQDEPNAEEKETMQDWTELIDKLLGSEHMNPTVIVSKDGASLEVASVVKNPDEINIREPISITTEPAVETTTDAETLTTDDTLFVADEPQTDLDDPKITSFFTSLWDVIKASVKYAGDFIMSITSTTNQNETPADATSTDLPVSSVATLLSLEEPAKQSQLPSQEFEKRGRDIDSLLYGHGIV